MFTRQSVLLHYKYSYKEKLRILSLIIGSKEIKGIVKQGRSPTPEDIVDI